MTLIKSDVFHIHLLSINTERIKKSITYTSIVTFIVPLKNKCCIKLLKLVFFLSSVLNFSYLGYKLKIL